MLLNTIKVLTFVCLTLTFSCQSKEKDDSSSDESSEEGSTDSDDKTDDGATTTGALAIESVDQIELSSALNVKIPENVDGKGEPVPAAEAGTIQIGLTQTKKSREACLMRVRIKRSIAMLKHNAVELCFVEKLLGKSGIGKKYRDSYGDGSFSIYSRRIEKDGIEVNICEDDEPIQKYTVIGSAQGRSIGSFKIYDEEDNQLFTLNGKFDNGFTKEGVVKMQLKSFEADDEIGAEYIDSMNLRLHPTGLSRIQITSEGFESLEGEMEDLDEEAPGFVEYKDQMSALIGPKLGSILINTTYSDDLSDGTESYGYRAFFDRSGSILDAKDSPAFAKVGGKLHIDPKSIPKSLGKEFRIDPFGANDWDCSDTEPFPLTDEEPDFTSCDALAEETDALEMELEEEEEKCFDEQFAWSDEEDLDESLFDEDLDDDFNFEDVEESDVSTLDESGELESENLELKR